MTPRRSCDHSVARVEEGRLICLLCDVEMVDACFGSDSGIETYAQATPDEEDVF